MKFILIFLFSMVTIFGFCQPGPPHQNLNEINDEGIIQADIIVIDSTSDLTKVSSLKKSEELRLKMLYLDEIPKGFKNFVNTKSLTIEFYKVNCTDLSFINEFPNLKTLRIDGYVGELLSNEYLKLDSLISMQIGYSENLYDISAIKKINSLEKLSLKNVASLREFPRFSNQNSIRVLKIDHMSNGRYFNRENPKAYKTDIENIQHLLHLEELYLGSLTHIHSIPDYLPQNLQKLEINAWALHHWKGDKVEINNIENLGLYPNLKDIVFSHIYLNDLNGNLGNLSLDNLYLKHMQSLTDISWVFALDSIKYFQIYQCPSLTTISGTDCNATLGKIKIDQCPNIEDLDFLFSCDNLNSIEFYSQYNILKLSKSINMDKIPNISISNSNQTIELFKKENVWLKRTIEE